MGKHGIFDESEGGLTVQTNAGEIPVQLDSLAAEARLYTHAATANMLQLGRVLIEAKKLVAHGQWESWIKTNAGGISMRVAQNMMAAYSRFHDAPGIEGISQTNLVMLLSLPEEKTESFIAEHDVKGMTAQELRQRLNDARAEGEKKGAVEASKAAKEEAEGKIKAAKEAAEAEADGYRQQLEEAEARAEEAENALEVFREELREAQSQYKKQAEEEARKAITDAEMRLRAAQAESERLKRELREAEGDNEILQDRLDKAEENNRNLGRQLARGDEDRETHYELTHEELADAVQTFMMAAQPTCVMGRTFSRMCTEEKDLFRMELFRVISWVKQTESALDEVDGEGVVIHE